MDLQKEYIFRRELASPGFSLSGYCPVQHTNCNSRKQVNNKESRSGKHCYLNKLSIYSIHKMVLLKCEQSCYKNVDKYNLLHLKGTSLSKIFILNAIQLRTYCTSSCSKQCFFFYQVSIFRCLYVPNRRANFKFAYQRFYFIMLSKHRDAGNVQ